MQSGYMATAARASHRPIGSLGRPRFVYGQASRTGRPTRPFLALAVEAGAEGLACTTLGPTSATAIAETAIARASLRRFMPVQSAAPDRT
jgi:hypothetical protein